MSWFKVPNGGDGEMEQALKWIVFYFALPLGVLIVLAKIYPYLSEKLDGGPNVSGVSQTDTSTWQQSFSSTTDTLGSLLLILIGVLISGLVLYILSRWLLYRYYRARASEGVQYLQILPSNDIRLEIEKVMTLMRTFGGMIRIWRKRLKYGTPWFRIRFALPEHSNQIGIYLAYPKDKKSSVFDTIRSIYPSAEIHDLSKEQFPEPKEKGDGGHFRFQRGRRKGLPLASLEQKKESQLGNILNSLRPGTFLDLQFAPVSWKQLEDRSEDALDDLKKKKVTEMDPEERARKYSLLRRLTGRELTFQVRLSIWSNHENASNVVRSTANAIETTMNYDGAIRFWKHHWWNPIMDQNPVPYPIPFTIMTWTGEELGNLFHIPPADHWIYDEPDVENERGYIVHLVQNQRSLDENEWSEGVSIGRLKHPIDQEEVRVPYSQLSKHFLLTGANGMGKSSTAVEMIQSMIDEWVKDPNAHPGFTLIDPAREIIAIIENRLRTLEEKGIEIPHDKIHHYNLSDDTTHMIGLNLLHHPEGYTINQVAEQMADVILHKFGQGESLIRSKRLLSMAIHSLLEDNEKHTILGIDDLFRNENFRNKVLQNGKDPYVKRFWSKIGEREKREMELLLGRIEPLLQDPTLRRMFLQKEMALEIDQYMDEGHLVFFDLLGMKDHEIKLTVGQLVNQYYRVAQKRPFGSKFHLMMIEEAHQVQLPLFRDVFWEDRQLDFGLGLITRDIDQFDEDREYLQALKANIGMILSCAQQEGADNVEDLTRGYLKRDYLEKLPERTVAVYIRSKRNQRSDISTFVVENHPPYVCTPDGDVADHKSKEKEEALAWGLEWGADMMAEDPKAIAIDQLDEKIAEYMNQSTDWKRNDDAKSSSA